MSKHENEIHGKPLVIHGAALLGSGDGPATLGEGLPAIVSSLAARFAEDAGAGRENVTSDAMALPFLKLLQAKGEAETDPERYKAGMLLHSITGNGYDIREKGGKPLHFLLCHFSKQIVEWGDKDAGNGGLKARHACTAASLEVYNSLPKNDKKKVLAPSLGKTPFPPAETPGNLLEETAYHYMLMLLEDGALDVGVLPLKSTGLTPSKKLMRQVDTASVKAPTFAKIYSVESFLDEQKTGAHNKFYNVRFAVVGDVTDAMEYKEYAAAKAFYLSISGGKAKLDDQAESAATGAPDAGGDNDVSF